MAGYFRDADTLIRELSSPRIHPGAQVYFSLNAINEACYDRKARDRFVESMKPTVSDTDVEGYDWLLIDVDPKRPSGTGSTEAQVRESREKARQIYHYLRESRTSTAPSTQMSSIRRTGPRSGSPAGSMSTSISITMIMAISIPNCMAA